MHQLIANIAASGWTVHFMETDCRTHVGPWLLLDTEERLMAMLSRVTATPEAMDEMRVQLNAWGRTSLHIGMTDQQYDDLVAAGLRDPRTAYDKRKALERR